MYDALVVVSFGGPEKHEDVIPFLENVLRGRNVPRERMLEVAEHYYHFDGRSPINDQNRALQQYGMDQGFYQGQRSHDLAQAQLGSSLQQSGLQTYWSPMQQASDIFKPYTGFGSTTQSSQQGGGAMGVAGGLLGGAQLAKNAGWW